MDNLNKYFSQDKKGGIVWIKENTFFGFSDIVTWAGKGKLPFEKAAGKIDLVLTGPHSSAAIPMELKPFILENFTQRMQFDYSDVSTDAVAQRWAEIDEHVVYIRNPHSRLVFDQNRAPVENPEEQLRLIFKQVALKKAGQEASFSGIDSIRPVTFADHPVLKQPKNDAEWKHLIAIITTVAKKGSLAYASTRDKILETIFEKKCRLLHEIDLRAVNAMELHGACCLNVQCIHDTMNAKAFSDGAVSDKKPAENCLPKIATLSNRGDHNGEIRPDSSGGQLDHINLLTCTGHDLRTLKRAFQLSFGIQEKVLSDHLRLNFPYYGAWEVQKLGQVLKFMESHGQIAHGSGQGILSIKTGAYQSEFLREMLMGKINTKKIQTPGKTWPEPDTEHVDYLAQRFKKTYDILRCWNFNLAMP